MLNSCAINPLRISAGCKNFSFQLAMLQNKSVHIDCIQVSAGIVAYFHTDQGLAGSGPLLCEGSFREEVPGNKKHHTDEYITIQVCVNDGGPVSAGSEYLQFLSC